MLPLLILGIFGLTKSETVVTTKFFAIPVEPTLFNWTLMSSDKFEYYAKLLDYPDLPHWIHYMYSRQHQAGFLYGVPVVNQNDLEIVRYPCEGVCSPTRQLQEGRLQIELIATNLLTYETRRRVIHLSVQDKPSLAKNQVHLKIDNLDIEDLFDTYRLTKLLDIFRNKLWRESYTDLYVTFLESAVAQGGRLPLKPNEKEGVVIRLGSAFEFSSSLRELQEEVRPLWKLKNCPRDYKRTTVERIFRDEGFALDWCSFHLIEEDFAASDTEDPEQFLSEINEPIWIGIKREDLPFRKFGSEFLYTILAPISILVILMAILSGTLCFNENKMDDDTELFFRALFLDCEQYMRSRRNKKITSDVISNPKAANNLPSSEILTQDNNFQKNEEEPKLWYC